MKYSANDNLEIMKTAKNYNGFLIGILTKIIKKHNIKLVLDYGCAQGFFMSELQKKVKNIELFGIEIDDDSIKICKDNNLNVYRNIDDVRNKFDFIYSFNVLEHIEDDEYVLKKFYEKLSDKGYIIVYVPAINCLWTSMDDKTGHYRRYTKTSLKQKIKNAGFKIDSIEYCDCIGVAATLLYKLKDKIYNNNNGNINTFQIKIFDYIFPFGRILDKLFFRYLIGKNLLLVASKI